MRPLNRLIWVPALLIPLALTGCGMMRGFAYLFAPRQIQKPEFVPTEGRLAIVLDAARPRLANPVFEVNLHKKIVAYFRENGVKCQVVPYEDVMELQQATPNFQTWSIQKIGRRLGAAQVLYVRVEQLQLGDLSDAVFTPSVELRVKVIGVQDPSVHARLWPRADEDPDGREVTHQRSPVEAESLEIIDSETAKLARETAYYVARFFHKYDLEDNPPHER